MRQCILDMALIPHLVRTQPDAKLGVEAARLARVASPTPDVVAVDVAPQFLDVLAHEAYYRACVGQLHERAWCVLCMDGALEVL
jgi:hypothetical protein